MRILIVTEVLPPAFHWSPSEPRRGTERFYVETARALAKKGHEVVVEYDGPVVNLEAQNQGYFTTRNNTLREDRSFEPDAILLCNQRGPFRPGADQPRGETRVVWWTNFADFRLSALTYRDADAVVVISNYASNLAGSGTADSPPLYVVPHGVDKSRFKPSIADSARSKVCLFTSSPDRGGTFLRDHWGPIEKMTGYQLVQSPYPGDPVVAPWTEPYLAQAYRTSRFWLHPGLGTELFCLSAAEAQASGCVPIVVPNGALAETVRWGHRFPEDRYLAGLLSVLKADYVGGANADHLLDWDRATELLESVLSS